MILQEQNTCVAGIFIYYSHTVTNVLISNSTKLSSSSITWIDHQRDFHWNCFSTIVVDQGHYIVSVIRLYYGEAEAGWFELYVCLYNCNLSAILCSAITSWDTAAVIFRGLTAICSKLSLLLFKKYKTHAENMIATSPTQQWQKRVSLIPKVLWNYLPKPPQEL